MLLKDGNLAELALSLKTGITYFTLSNATTTGLPSSEAKWSYGHGIILVRMPEADAKIILHSLMTAEVAINTCNNGIWTGWNFCITKSDLVNPYKTLLLAWGNYSDGTYTLSESIFGRSISIAVGINGRLRGTWIPTSTNDIRSIVIPGGIIDVKILSATQVQITGTTADYRVREIFAI